MHAKMQSESGKRTYHRRMHIGETPFAIIKGIFAALAVLLRWAAAGRSARSTVSAPEDAFGCE